MELGTSPSWVVMHWVFKQDWKHNWPELLPPAMPPWPASPWEADLVSTLWQHTKLSPHPSSQDPKAWLSSNCTNTSEEEKNASKWKNSRLRARGGNRRQNSKRVKAVQNPKYLQTNHLFCVPNLSSSNLFPFRSKERWEHLQPHSPRLCSHRKPSQTSQQVALKIQEIPSLVLCILFSAKRKCLMPSVDFTTLVAIKSEWNILWPPTP